MVPKWCRTTIYCSLKDMQGLALNYSFSMALAATMLRHCQDKPAIDERCVNRRFLGCYCADISSTLL